MSAACHEGVWGVQILRYSHSYLSSREASGCLYDLSAMNPRERVSKTYHNKVDAQQIQSVGFHCFFSFRLILNCIRSVAYSRRIVWIMCKNVQGKTMTFKSILSIFVWRGWGKLWELHSKPPDIDTLWMQRKALGTYSWRCLFQSLARNLSQAIYPLICYGLSISETRLRKEGFSRDGVLCGLCSISGHT
jgi:hypothetical protein